MKVHACLALILILLAVAISAVAQSATTTSPASSAVAQVPPVIQFSHIATEAGGGPLTGTVEMTFSLYANAQGGDALWTEKQSVTLDNSGHYSVYVGVTKSNGVPMVLFTSGEAHWLGVQVAGQPEQPRVFLVSVPYAMKAGDAATIGGLPPSAFVLARPAENIEPPRNRAYASAPPVTGVDVTTSGTATVNAIPLFNTATDIENSVITQGVTGTAKTPLITIGSGTQPAGLFLPGKGTLGLNVAGVAKIGSTVAGGFSWGTVTLNGQIVLHNCCNTTTLRNIFVGGAGNFGKPGTENTGLGPLALAGLNETVLTFRNTAVGYESLYGQVTGSYNSALGALAGESTVSANANTTGSQNTFVGYASGPGTATQLTNATAIGAYATVSQNNSLILGSINGTNGAVASVSVGIGTPSPGATLDVRDNGSGNPTISATTGAVNNAVLGNNTSTSGNANGAAFYTASPAGTAVVGVNTAGGYAGYFQGNVNVTGSLSKGSGSFKIDHPLDPANKYLYHSFVESPDMMNVYNGNITTDVSGLAVVTLPDWFEALNRDFRYQLTVIGQFAQAIVASEVSHNQFMIRTDRPNVKVSWQVTGIRQDAYANAHRIQVEEDKPPQDQGHYLHPELFGAGPEQAVGYHSPGRSVDRGSESSLKEESGKQAESIEKPHNGGK